MNRRVLTRRLSLLSLAAAVGVFAANVGSSAHAALSWYDGFAIGDPDDGAGPNYVAGNLAGQLGGSDAGSGVGFFDDAVGNPNPWLGVNNTDPTDTDNAVGNLDSQPAGGSLSRPGQSMPSSGDKADSGAAVFGGCCYTGRQSRDLNTPLQLMNGTIYMSFLVNFGAGNRADPHYRAVEFWNGKRSDPLDPNSIGRVGDQVLTMSLGVSSFGNYDDPINDADGPGGVTANRQISLKTTGVRSLFGLPETQNVQLNEHMEYSANQQYGQTHEVVMKFDLTTDDIEGGGVGDTLSVFLDPTLADVVEPAPSAVVSGIDLNVDSMSNMILFTFTGGTANQGAFDELRVGTTWAETAILSAPEPASLSLFALGAFGLLATARRRRG